MKILLSTFACLMLCSCEFQKADYYDRYSNIDFGEDVGNSSGSSFDYSGSSYNDISTRTNYYRGSDDEASNSSKDSKKSYSRHYLGVE